MRFNFNTLLLILLILVGIYILIAPENRHSLLALHTVNLLGIGTFMVPFGAMLIGGWGLTALLFALVNSFSRLRREADSARILRDMEGLRSNLDKAEGSRFAELQAYLDKRLGDIQTQVSTQAADVSASSSRTEAIRNELRDNIGQLDDYLKRKLGS